MPVRRHFRAASCLDLERIDAGARLGSAAARISSTGAASRGGSVSAATLSCVHHARSPRAWLFLRDRADVLAVDADRLARPRESAGRQVDKVDLQMKTGFRCAISASQAGREHAA
jgi:hypothetical protein